MAENKLVMGYWDCAFCGEKKIPGTQRACPCCGKVRGADAVFYMDGVAEGQRISEEEARKKQKLTEEEAQTKGKGADWYCSFCDSMNSALDENCKSCGASRAESEANYFELQEKKRLEALKKEQEKLEATRAREEPAAKKRSPLFFLLPLVLLGALIFMMMPKKADLKITDVFWHNLISIEKNTQLEESDWIVPDGGEVQTQRRELYGYEKVLDHYETVHYQERVPSGSHTEYSYQNNGDGTFTEVPHQVTDYTYEDRTRQEAVYRDDPVYRTKYYYLIWRWIPERTVETEGHDKEPKWGDPQLGENEREAYRESYYTVTGEKKGNERVYNVSEAIWNQLKVGDQIECVVHGNEIIELK